MIDRETLIRHGWGAIVSIRETPLLGTGTPNTLAWLWNLAADVLRDAPELRFSAPIDREPWLDAHASREAQIATHPIERVMAICAELKTWDMDLAAQPTQALDKLARRHLGAVAHQALTAMVEAVVESDTITAELRQLVRMAAEAEAGTDDTESFQDAIERSDRINTLREALIACLQASGAAEPEDLARALVANQRRTEAQG